MRYVHEQAEKVSECSFIKEKFQKEPETPESLKLPVALLPVGVKGLSIYYSAQVTQLVLLKVKLDIATESNVFLSSNPENSLPY